jgi:hypothetical protein
VVAVPGEVEAPPAVRPDRAGHPDRDVEGASLLDVQLDERPDAAGQPGQPARGRTPEGLAERDALPVLERGGLLRLDGPGQKPGPQARYAEPAALLLDEGDHGDRPSRHVPAAAQLVDGQEAADDAERSVVAPAVRDRVEVRAGEHRVLAPLVAPPGEQVAVAVVGDRHVAARGLVAEPVPQHQFGLLQRVAQIATVADPADRRDPVPEFGERRAHRASRIGMCTPEAACDS